MVPGAGDSDERPLPNILSEREVLLKAADAAILEGILNTSYYAYQRNSDFMTAKIETPILVTNAESGVPTTYLLNTVDDSGISLARIYVNANRGATAQPFVRVHSLSEFKYALDHIITKREANEMIKTQFPNNTVSDPIMINNLELENDRIVIGDSFCILRLMKRLRITPLLLKNMLSQRIFLVGV